MHISICKFDKFSHAYRKKILFTILSFFSFDYRNPTFSRYWINIKYVLVIFNINIRYQKILSLYDIINLNMRNCVMINKEKRLLYTTETFVTFLVPNQTIYGKFVNPFLTASIT